ncbi:N-acetylneuraminate synthase family protein [Tissierella praeacuta]|uniref:N-acetylneuraminate synthase family protein n=1 Tax=Tissierella praeacuta TaxID=43131 RepID=UPI0028A97BFF|nr:N-acetylneuraminate synthase family protein [Tissierella praeacuta]
MLILSKKKGDYMTCNNQFIQIGSRKIGDVYPTYIIAEVGSNHDGNIENAKRYILAAKEIGADAVKFQAFTADRLVNKDKLPEIYTLMNDLEISMDWLPILNEYAKKIGIEFLCTPFDIKSAEILFNLGINAFKISSGDITNIPLLRYIGSRKLPVILSTGMSYLKEIEEALQVLSCNGVDEIGILHCISKYPPRYEEMNLNVLKTLKQAFNYVTGFSDHSEENIGTIAAITLGARIIEKHITFDKTLPGADHPFALTVSEFEKMINDIRKLELALGNGVKRPTIQEIEGPLKRARRSIFAGVDIPSGTMITEDMLKVVRPVIGLEPKYIDIIVGKRAKINISKYDEITWDKILS